MNKTIYDMKMQAMPDEKTINGLMENLPQKAPKSRTRFTGTVIAAAAALSMLTVGAGAATNWTFGILPDPSSVFADERLSEYNAVTEAVFSNTVTDYGFELIGAATDGHLLNVIVDIYPPDGQTFNEDNIPSFTSIDGLTFQMSIESESAYGTGATYKFTDVTPEKLRAELKYDCTIPMDGKQIKLYAGRNLTNEEGNVVDFEALWEAELTTIESGSRLTYENIDNTKLTFPVKPEYGADQESFIIPEKIDVSFMSFTVYGRFSLFSPMIYLKCADNYVKLADGSTVALKTSGGSYMDMGSYGEGSQTFEFAESVAPENVVSIVLDGHEIILK